MPELPPAAAQVVARCLGTLVAELEAVPLSGGLVNRIYRIQGRDQACVLRLPVTGAASSRDPHRLGTEREAQLIETAARANLAPRVLHADNADGLLVTEFLEGASAWTPALARTPANIERLAALLRTFHGLDIELPPLQIVAVAQSYRQHALQNRALSATERAWAHELAALADEFQRRYPPMVPCHNDLVAANILDDGELRLIDFEYATQSHPILDLAGVAALNDYDVQHRTLLLRSYYGAACPISDRAFLRAQRLVLLLALFWALARVDVAPVPRDLAALIDRLMNKLRTGHEWRAL